MNRGDVGLVLGLAGFLVGCAAFYLALSARGETTTRWTDVKEMVKSDEEHLTAWGEQMDAFKGRLSGLDERVGRTSSDSTAVWDAIHDLQSRAAVLEAAAGIQRAKLSVHQPTEKELEEAEKKRLQKEQNK